MVSPRNYLCLDPKSISPAHLLLEIRLWYSSFYWTVHLVKHRYIFTSLGIGKQKSFLKICLFFFKYYLSICSAHVPGHYFFLVFFSPATLNQPPSLLNSSTMTSLESIFSLPPLEAHPVISHLHYCTSCQTSSSGPLVHINPRTQSVTFPKCKSLYFASLVKTLRWHHIIQQ